MTPALDAFDDLRAVASRLHTIAADRAGWLIENRETEELEDHLHDAALAALAEGFEAVAR